MTEQEKLVMLEECLDMEEGALKADMELEELEEWDSLSKLSLMAEAKKRMGKQLTIEEMMGFKTIQDILDYFN